MALANVGVDLGPAEAELRKAYTALLPEVQRLGSEGFTRVNGASSLHYNNPFAKVPDMPVLHIVAKGRRVEYGWFHEDKWETHSSKIASKLGAQGVKKTHDEVFIAGEALGWDAEKLVQLLIHQILHQFSGEASDTTMHSKRFGMLAQYIGVRTVVKHATRGYTEWRDLEGRLATVIMNVAKSINKTAFNIYRKDEGEIAGNGRMKQWTCACQKPKVYTGGVLRMICEKCGDPLRYSHKDRMLQVMHDHLVARRGLPADRIAPWVCSECHKVHNWVGNYPNDCYTKTAVKPVTP